MQIPPRPPRTSVASLWVHIGQGVGDTIEKLSLLKNLTYRPPQCRAQIRLFSFWHLFPRISLLNFRIFVTITNHCHSFSLLRERGSRRNLNTNIFKIRSWACGRAPTPGVWPIRWGGASTYDHHTFLVFVHPLWHNIKSSCFAFERYICNQFKCLLVLVSPTIVGRPFA